MAPAPGLVLAGGAYALVTVLLAWPLVRDIAGVLPSDLGDPVLNTWILWHNATTLPFTNQWWSPPVFHPSPNVLAYSEHLFGLSLLSTPVYWLTGSPIVAYNVTFLLTFLLSGLATYLLVFELTSRRDAAWLAGLAFAFAPYRMDQLAHLQVLASYWMPLGLFALHRYYRRGEGRWLLLFGGSGLMNGLSNGYYLLFYPLLILPWVLWFTTNEGWWRRTLAVAGIGTVAVMLLTPSLLTYQAAHDDIGLRRTPAEIRTFSADAAGLVSGPPHSVAWSFPEAVWRPEGQLFPGLTTVALVGLALWRVRWRPRGPEPSGLRVVRSAVALVGLVFAAALLVRAVVGPWQLAFPGLPISTVRMDKVIAQGMLAWFLWALLSPPGAWAYRRHSPFAFYCVATFLLFMLALGPEPQMFGHRFMSHSVYSALTWLPGYDSLRAPARFWMLATICTAALVGLSFTRLVPLTHRYRRAGVAVLTIGLLTDGWIALPVVAIPARSAVLDQIDGGLLELPLGLLEHDTTSMLRATDHRQPLVNGYSGYAPPHYAALQAGLATHLPEMLDIVAAHGVRFVRIDRSLDTDGALERFVSAHGGSRLVAQAASEALFELPRRVARRDRPPGSQMLEIAEIRANVNPHLAGQMVDDKLESRWQGGPQVPGQEVWVDLGSPHAIGAVVMHLGPYRADFPRGLAIDLSVDGRRWSEVWAGPLDVLAVRGALHQPREQPLACDLAGRVGRYIRLRTTGADPIFYWSIAELAVLAPS